MQNFLLGTRFLILLPILGLGLAAAAFFIPGGYGLIRLLFEVITGSLGGAHQPMEGSQGVIIFEAVEYVHTFLVGTVLYITAVGLYQMFIRRIDLVGWLKMESTEELETNLIGVTVVVLAVNFMGAVLIKTTDLFDYGSGIALPIAALGLFLGFRAWSTRLGKETTSASGKHSEEVRTRHWSAQEDRPESSLRAETSKRRSSPATQ